MDVILGIPLSRTVGYVKFSEREAVIPEWVFPCIGLPLLKLLAPRWKKLTPIDASDERSDALYEYLYHVNVQPAR